MLYRHTQGMLSEDLNLARYAVERIFGAFYIIDCVQRAGNTKEPLPRNNSATNHRERMSHHGVQQR